MGITVTRAGKLIVDEDGYVTATLASIEVVDHPEDSNGNRKQLEFIFKVPTNKGTSDKHLWTGVTINAEKSYYPVDPQTGEREASPEYNLLTQMLLALGTLSEESLKSDDEINFDIESLVGRAFKFHVIPSRTNPSLSDIVVKSMCFAETDVRLATANTTK
ncbi:hypothetical protein [Nostoc commune]|uniref:hypothetical protein n=1 Tax=Nostoc commune TaxID=1178 RepID=UPI0018C66AE6|nr:hypothetical protein [Nostoc commune]MBG1258415.1 hypothetical protein [Nostoc commune BAE]